MTYSARVICDSIAQGVRLTTLEVTFPRIVLAEFNTHRVFCLAGDSELEFDLPKDSRGRRRVYRMRLDDFVDKWLNGARRTGANPKTEYDTQGILPESHYSPQAIASLLGMATASNINTACRAGVLPATKTKNGWSVRGADVLAWRQSSPAHTRFDMRSRLKSMRIRQLNEDTGDIQTSHVRDVQVSGVKPVYVVRAGDYEVAGSKDHRILTTKGWLTIGELAPGDQVLVRRFGKREDELLDPLRLKKIEGVWRSRWQRTVRELLRSASSLCRRCEQNEGVDIHHIVPVHEAPERAFEKDNITLLCPSCHLAMHEVQGWQGGTYLYGAAATVTSVEYRGEEMTYDLEIAGSYPNFLANGVVVHNSRNSASSRAIPVEKRIAAIQENPFVPEAFAANKKGMQAGDVLDRLDQEHARHVWMAACEEALKKAQALVDLGVHKQWANRILEPFSWHTVVVTSTEWENFFNLRISELAQPEIRIAAELMLEAMEDSSPLDRDNSEVRYHLPYLQADEWYDLLANPSPQNIERAIKLSTARCARVSYLTHDGKYDPEADLRLYNMLLTNRHMSPFEHVAYASVIPLRQSSGFLGNFRRPWVQHRKTLPGEDIAPKEVPA